MEAFFGKQGKSTSNDSLALSHDSGLIPCIAGAVGTVLEQLEQSCCEEVDDFASGGRPVALRRVALCDFGVSFLERIHVALR
jgi:hypothetical protein